MEGREERKIVPLRPEAAEALQQQLEAFRQKFGRDPRPEDPIFFDPDEDEPTSLTVAGWNAAFVEAATEVGMDPAYIYAVQRTGMFLTEMNRGDWSEGDLAEFEAAIEEYHALERQETSPVVAARDAEQEDAGVIGLLEQTPTLVAAMSKALAEGNADYVQSVFETVMQAGDEDASGAVTAALWAQSLVPLVTLPRLYPVGRRRAAAEAAVAIAEQLRPALVAATWALRPIMRIPGNETLTLDEFEERYGAEAVFWCPLFSVQESLRRSAGARQTSSSG